MKPKHYKRGFTLVEILVTITIIVTLAAATFLIASRARQSALSAKTINNLREIGVCSALWMSENNNFYPPAWDNTQGANRSYAQVLDPYMHGVTPFRNLQSKFIGPNKRIPVEVNRWSHPITYTMNRAVCRDITVYDKVGETLVHATKVANPTEVILMADGCQNPRNLGQANAYAYRIWAAVGQTGPSSKSNELIPVGPDADTSAGDGWFRYPSGKCHALFCDGSAKAFAKGTIKNRNIWLDVTE
jgi:prepilin-type N-terminal cleavage/methylation domain-containing protein/prepilin-type processing-associated H-X9-DG protein